jgi:hypothetical protein
MTASASPAGLLQLRVRASGGILTEVTLTSTRPRALGTVLVGRSLTEGVRLAGLLLPLCGMAHQAAALLGAGRDASALESPVRAENAVNHGWRLCIAWPALLGEAPQLAALAALRAQPSQAGLDALAADDLVARMRTRLVDQAWGLEAMLDHAVEAATRCFDPATPVLLDSGAVLTSRGPLRHRLTLTGDRVSRWEIDAPTDLAFAPDGPLVRRLRGAPCPPDLAFAIRALVTLMDPCVPCDIDVQELAHA